MKSLIIISLLFSSCTMRMPEQHGFRTYVTDTALSHLPFNEIDFSKKLSTGLNLPIIYRGVDSFELRIWISSMIIPSRGVVFSYVNDKWRTFNYEYYGEAKTVDSIRITAAYSPKNV